MVTCFSFSPLICLQCLLSVSLLLSTCRCLWLTKRDQNKKRNCLWCLSRRYFAQCFVCVCSRICLLRFSLLCVCRKVTKSKKMFPGCYLSFLIGFSLEFCVSVPLLLSAFCYSCLTNRDQNHKKLFLVFELVVLYFRICPSVLFLALCLTHGDQKKVFLACCMKFCLCVPLLLCAFCCLCLTKRDQNLKNCS